MAIIVPILSTFNDKGIKSAIREFQTAKTSIQKFSAVGKVFDGVGKSLTKNVTLPLVAIGGALAVMVKGAIEAQSVQNRLRQILLTTGGATEKQVDALIAQAEALEKVGVVSKENIIATQSQLATFDLQARTISRLTPAILNYVTAEKGASATTEDFKSMTNGLAQALNGQFGSLTRVGFVLDEDTKKKIANGTESERAAAIVEVLNSTYEGFNETLLNTPEGQLIKLQQEFGNLRDELGTALLPVLNDFTTFIRNDIVPIVRTGAGVIKVLIERFAALNDGTKRQIGIFVLMVAAIGPLLVLIGSLIRATVALIGVFALLTKAIVLIPLIIIGLIGAFRAQSDAQYQLARESGNTWTAIAVIIEKSVHSVLWVVENFINGFKVAGLAIDHFGRLVNNAFKWAGGQIPDSLMSFEERLNSLVKFSFVDFTSGTENIADTLINLGDTFSKIKEDVSKYEEQAMSAAEAAAALEEQLKDLSNAQNDNADAAAEQKRKMQELRDALVRLRQDAVDKLNDSLRDAQSQLDAARTKFDDFKKSITGNIESIIDFEKASEGENFLQGLIGQAAEATNFAEKIKKLIQLGLSERGLQQVLSAGFEAGSKIADELIAGGSTVVTQVNELLKAVASVADQVGDMGAKQFYLAGVEQGEALVNGILTALRAAQKDLIEAQRLAATGGAIANVGGTLQQALRQEAISKGNLRALDLINKVTQGGKGKVSAEELKAIQSAGIGKGLVHPKNRLAKGGIVLGPTNALIGEAGPEAVVPLSGSRSGGMGNTYNITINAGIGTDGSTVGRQIVEAIKKYERSSGQVFARA